MVIRRRINIECLKKTSLDNPVAINFFTMLENSYSKNMKTLAVKTILNRMWKLGLYENKEKKGPIRKLLNELENARCGEYIKGSRGHPSRFVWHYNMLDVAKLALEYSDEFEPEPLNDSSDSDEFVEHCYLLRRDYKFVIRLPYELTRYEGLRLGLFVQGIAYLQEEDFDDYEKSTESKEYIFPLNAEVDIPLALPIDLFENEASLLTDYFDSLVRE